MSKRAATGVLGVALLTAGPTPAWAQNTGAQLPGAGATVVVPDRALLERQAADIIVDASRSEDAMMRANAMEAAQWMPDRALPMAQLGVQDENPAVRFAALYTIGKLRLLPMGEAIRSAHRGEQVAHVRAAVIFAAARCGMAQDALVSDMSRHLFDADPAVRANAAMLMGEMGNGSAIGMLRQAALRPAGDRSLPIRWSLLRVQTAEAQVKLGDAEAINAIRGAAYSGLDEVRILAVQTLGRLGDDAMRGNFANFLSDNPVEFRLAAAEALAVLGDDRGLPVMLEAANAALVTQRAQAAFALGRVNRPEAVATLAKLMEDDEPMVRLSAAAAVLRGSR